MATSRSKSSTTAKTASSAEAASTAAPITQAAADTEPGAPGSDIKKRELIDLVVERSGVKKKSAKPVVEAMLAVLGESLAAERGLNLRPMGKMRVNRVEDKENGRIIVCRLRQPKEASGTAAEPLADNPE